MYKHEVVVATKGLPFKVIIHKHSVIQIVRHWHRSVEINFTIHGDGDYFVSGKKTHISDGEFIVINSNEVHGVENIGPGDKRRSLTLLIPWDVLEKLKPNFDQYLILSQSSNPTDMAKIKNELNAIYQVWTTLPEETAHLEVLGHFYLLMSELFQRFLVKKNNLLYYKSEKSQSKVKKIIGYLDEHYQENLSLDIVASNFGFSRGYMARFFKKEVGQGVMSYLQLIRLSHAYEQLISSDKSIEYIATSSGYPNTKSFERTFKAVYKTAPNKYRKSLQGN